jgi:hypothetical protein
MKVVLVVNSNGTVASMYNDVLRDLDLGPISTQRASSVEWDRKTQEWVAKVVQTGEVLARGGRRGEVVAREVEVLQGRL